MVLALQVAVELAKFQGTRFVANINCVSILREFGPVFTALLLAGRAGSAMTAELGTMKITEQLSAMKMLGLDIYKYLLAPRIVGCILGCVTLTLFFDLVGIVGGYAMAVVGLDIPFAEYHANTLNILNWRDISIGLIKAGVFGLIISTVGCFWGLKTEEGAKGVGEFTKRSVVTSSIAIIISDFFLSKILLNVFGLWG
jgi:phospholipid/cholesterol/gamma-HCH transport system permease protein